MKSELITSSEESSMYFDCNEIQRLLVTCFRDVLSHPTATDDQLAELADRFLFTIFNFKPYTT